jgi:hypothetical protein
MRLVDWTKHAAKKRGTTRTPRTYSSLSSPGAGNYGQERAKAHKLMQSTGQSHLNMLVDRLQKDNDGLTFSVGKARDEVEDLKAETDALLEMLATEREENGRLLQQLKQFEQFSSDFKVMKKMDEEIRKLEHENLALKKTNAELQLLYDGSEQQVQFYQSALVQLRATKAPNLSPSHTHHSTTTISQRMHALKVEYANREKAFERQNEESGARTERLVAERNRLRQEVELLRSPGSRDGDALEVEGKPDEAVTSFQTSPSNKPSLTPPKKNVFLRFVEASHHQIHNTETKLEATQELSQFVRTNEEHEVLRFFEASGLDIKSIVSSIGVVLKTAARGCKSALGEASKGNSPALSSTPVFVNEFPPNLLKQILMCLHSSFEVLGLTSLMSVDSICELMRNISITRLFLEALEVPNEWEWYNVMHNALTEAGTKCVLVLLDRPNEAINVLFQLLAFKENKTRVPGSPKRTRAGVDDGTNIPRFVSEVLNCAVDLIGSITPIFENYELPMLFSQMAAVHRENRAASIAAAEEILLLASESRTVELIQLANRAIEMSRKNGREDDETNEFTEENSEEMKLVMHVRSVALESFRNHAMAKKIQRWYGAVNRTENL